MAKEFTLPELGENIETADILKVLISPGDNIQVDQNVLEIETDKATIEVPSDISGVVKEVKVKDGDKAKVGQVIFTVDTEGEQPAAKETKEKEPEQEKQTKPVQEEEKKEEKKEGKENFVAEPGREDVKSRTEKKGESIVFKLPELGENIVSADILAVKVKEGDKVEKDDILVEIETDKATIEVPSDVSGTVKQVFVKSGDKIKVGQDVVSFESEGASKEEEKITKTEQQVEQKKPATGQQEEKKEKEKIAVEEEKKREEKTTVKPKDYSSEEKQPVDPTKLAPAAPTVRRFAREIGVDINEVKGSGPGGRISIPDVKAYARELSQAEPEAQKSEGKSSFAGVPAEQLPDFSKWGEVEKKEMTNIRRKTAEHLSYSWATIPHVTQFDKADITDLERLRKMYGKTVEKAGGKLTITAILLKVISSALKAFPQFNTSIDMQNKQVLYKQFYNIGVAVDTEYGLLVPVIKNVDKKNIIELSTELNQLAEKARNKKLSLEEMQGGCFTITNLGGIGGTYFSPVVNSPEVAILGVSRGNYEQVYIEGKFETRLMLPLSLSYDHRIIDGADGIRFLRWVINALQQPFLMALEG